MTSLNKLFIPFISLYLIGINRGINYYKHSNPTIFLYKNQIYYGLFGGLIYINPFILPLIINKEIYRFEVYLRDLKEERNKTSYHDFF